MAAWTLGGPGWLGLGELVIVVIRAWTPPRAQRLSSRTLWHLRRGLCYVCTRLAFLCVLTRVSFWLCHWDLLSIRTAVADADKGLVRSTDLLVLAGGETVGCEGISRACLAILDGDYIRMSSLFTSTGTREVAPNPYYLTQDISQLLPLYSFYIFAEWDQQRPLPRHPPLFSFLSSLSFSSHNSPIQMPPQSILVKPSRLRSRPP